MQTSEVLVFYSQQTSTEQLNKEHFEMQQIKFLKASDDRWWTQKCYDHFLFDTTTIAPAALTSTIILLKVLLSPNSVSQPQMSQLFHYLLKWSYFHCLGP